METLSIVGVIFGIVVLYLVTRKEAPPSNTSTGGASRTPPTKHESN